MITLRFVADESWGSQLIGWFGAGHLSHVDVILPDGTAFGARSDHVGGQPPGVWPREPNYQKFSRRVTVTIPTAVGQEAQFYSFLQQQRGKPYDHLAILAFFMNRNWRETDSWICSELVAAALEKCKIVEKFYLDANKISPVPLALAVSAIPGTTFTDLGAS